MTLQSSEVGKLDSLQWEAMPELESSDLTVDVCTNLIFTYY